MSDPRGSLHSEARIKCIGIGGETLLSHSSEDFQSIKSTELQISEAQAQLAHYQVLLEELSGIYEVKFRQRVSSVAEMIRHLLDERKVLQAQVAQVLMQPGKYEALPPAAAVASHCPTLSRSPEVLLPRFESPSNNPSFRRLHFPSHIPSLFSSPKGRQIASLGGGLVLSLVMLGLLQLLNWRAQPPVVSTFEPGREQLPSPIASPRNLWLKAIGGPSWVRVERLDGGMVFDAILESGQRKGLALGSGLRIRSGRPDLLHVGVGISPAQRLASVSDLDWFEFRP